MNTRKDNHGVAIKKWCATSPGLIIRPLRYIAARSRVKNVNQKGEVYFTYNSLYYLALSAARAGNGQVVRAIARQFS